MLTGEENPFTEIMRNHPDAKLLDIVENHRDEYTDEALDAAEKVLQSRNISWTINEATRIERSYQSVQEEISDRLQNGENIQTIRADLKARGLNVFEYAEMDQEEAAKNNPDFAAKRNKIGLRVSAVVLTLYALMKVGSRDKDSGIIFVILILVVVVLLVISGFQKTKK